MRNKQVLKYQKLLLFKEYDDVYVVIKTFLLPYSLRT